MFRLTNEIPRNEVRIGSLVCDNKAVGRPSKHVYSGAPEQKPLCLRDILVSWTHQNVSSG